MQNLWDGPQEKQSEEAKEEDQNATRFAAASALAAFANPTSSSTNTATTSAAASAAARLRAYQEQAAAGYTDYSSLGNHSLSYQSQVAEALRRQEEEILRRRAIYNLQQQQVRQRQELQELEYARQLQQQRVAEMAARETYSREGMSVLEAIGARAPVGGLVAESKEEEKHDAYHGQHAPIAARGKPEAFASAIAAAAALPVPSATNDGNVATALAVPSNEASSIEIAVPARSTAPPKKKPRKRKASTSPGRSRKKAHTAGHVTVDDPVPPISDVEYENLETLMEQFCRVPLLSEFSRPVALLHPEIFPKYNKIVTHPIDLGHVCRAIRRRQYTSTRAVQLDMWRIFANCIKYHTCPTNKEMSVPSFVSIALHLRDYFNALWQEYMVPSDTPAGLASQKSKKPQDIYSKREKDRTKRIATTSATILSAPSLRKTAAAIQKFIDSDGRVDKLDTDAIIVTDNDDDMEQVVENLRKLQKKVEAISQTDQDYDVKQLVQDIQKCYSGDLFESRPALRIRLGHRIDRLIGKIIVNIFEANSRGVNQSSVWGCMAAAIWARENSKKPYWPALVLGIMAPEDQKEDWHGTLTERNERRLPEKLLSDLQAGKRKAEHAIRRQNSGHAEQMSFFLVEFMGTHEFIWVKETDIIETFDPDVDPNQSAAAGNVTKKKRSSRSTDVLGSEKFANAREEGRWALEEFEMQLNDTCGDLGEEEEDDDEDGDQEANYSYSVLCQSDDEAEAEDMAHHLEIGHDMTLSETDEANELLAGDGLLDFSAEGRKQARKRTTAMKKKKAEADKASSKSGRSKKGLVGTRTAASTRVKETDEKREQRELERRRKKRTRERERALKDGSGKKRRTSTGDDDAKASEAVAKRNPLADKTGRATAIVKAYLMGIAKAEDLKPLGASGVMALPAAQIDSTGLLGMALAFRAAAGDLDMPEIGEQKGKPWEVVDVDGPVSAKEREENLRKKKELLEKEIKRIKVDTQRRKDLRRHALVEKRQMIEEVIDNDNEVRRTLEKKPKKRPVAKKTPKAEAPDAEKNVDSSIDMEIDTSRAPPDAMNDEGLESGAASPVVVGQVVGDGYGGDDDDEDVVEATVVVNET